MKAISVELNCRTHFSFFLFFFFKGSSLLSDVVPWDKLCVYVHFTCAHWHWECANSPFCVHLPAPPSRIYQLVSPPSRLMSACVSARVSVYNRGSSCANVTVCEKQRVGLRNAAGVCECQRIKILFQADYEMESRVKIQRRLGGETPVTGPSAGQHLNT